MHRILSLLFVLIASATAMAQKNGNVTTNNTKTTDTATENILIEAYIDSLTAYRQRLDSLLALRATRGYAEGDSALSKRRDHRFTVVGSPLTFYQGVAKRQFSLADEDSVADAIDRSLLGLYLHRPDLVKDTDKNFITTKAVTGKAVMPILTDVVKEDTKQADDVIVVPEQNVDLVYTKPNWWKFLGTGNVQILQDYVSDNWYKGGESSYSMLAGVVLQLDYNNKSRWTWENKLEMRLGLQTTPSDTCHSFNTSEDLIRLTSKLGYRAAKNWYYTLRFLGTTQFMKGYKENDDFVYSDFFSPLNLNFALGMEWKASLLKNRLTGTVNISPIAANLMHYSRLSVAERKGYAPGQHGKWDYGSSFTLEMEWKIMERLKWISRLYAYTTYKYFLAEWENTFSFQFNRYLSTRLFLYPRFDDNAKERDPKYGYFQLKEFLSFGFNIDF